jgi:hypothetical protein
LGPEEVSFYEMINKTEEVMQRAGYEKVMRFAKTALLTPSGN